MRTIDNLKLTKSNKNIFKNKSYKALSKMIIVVYVLFTPIYLFRESLYKLNNQHITLLAGTAPNLIPSFLFTLIGIFYLVPFFKGTDSINKPMFIWLINAFNMILFLIIEYLHVFFNLGSWDNNDMIASLIGIIVSTFIYFKIRKDFIEY
jgi:hypothetical protein